MIQKHILNKFSKQLLCFGAALYISLYLIPASKATTVEHKIIPNSEFPSQSAFINKANELGTKGFQYDNELLFKDITGHLFHRVNDNLGIVHKFSYQAVPVDLRQSSKQFLETANTMGAQGYKYAGTYGAGAEFFNLFCQENCNGLINTYQIKLVSTDIYSSSADEIKRLHTMNAQSFSRVGAYYFGDDLFEVFNMTIIPNGTPVAIEDKLGLVSEETSADLNLLNALAAQGFKVHHSLDLEQAYTDGNFFVLTKIGVIQKTGSYLFIPQLNSFPTLAEAKKEFDAYGMAGYLFVATMMNEQNTLNVYEQQL